MKDKESVINLFFLGSGQHRDFFSSKTERGNLIYELYLMSQKTIQSDGTPQFNHLLDGVGGKPTQQSGGEPNPNPMPGQYVYVPDQNEPGKGTKVLDKKHSDKAASLLGNTLGFGVDENVHEAIAYVEQLIELKYPPKVLNLTGFSRGSYTAIIVANMLYHMYPEMKINLCLLDPVAGPTLKSNPFATVIPPNVNKALIFYQKHEEGLLFEAQSKNRIRIADPTKTIVQYEIVAGGHNAATKYEKEITSHAHRLASGLTYEAFTKDFGVEFVAGAQPMILKSQKSKKSRHLERELLDKKDMTNEGRLLLYIQMKQQDKHYAKQAKNKLVKRGHLTYATEEYVRDSDFFYNQRHREIFKQLLPKTFSYRFEMNAGNYSHDQINQELKDFAIKNYELYVALKPALTVMGFEEYEHNKFRVPEKPDGVYLVEECPILNNQPLVKENDELSYLLWAVTTAVNYAQIKTSTMRQAKIDDVANKLQKQINVVLKEESSKEQQIKKIEDAIRQASYRLQKEVGPNKLLSQLNAILNDPITYAKEANSIIEKNTKKQLAESNIICHNIQRHIADIASNSKLSNKDKNSRIDGALSLLQERVNQGNPKFSDEIKQLRESRKGQPQLIHRLEKRIESYLFKIEIKHILLQIKSFFGAVSSDEKQGFALKKAIMEDLKKDLTLMKSTGEAMTKDKLTTVLNSSLSDIAKLRDSKYKNTNVDDIYNVVMKCYDEVSIVRSEKTIEAKKEMAEPRASMETNNENFNI